VTDKYPLCPEGSQVLRTTNFQSCWDGQNIDSANHRDHMAFVQEDGSCPNGFQAVPQLQVRLAYDIPTPVVENGQVRNPYAVDSFPEQLHKPITDHNDFINVMDEDLMNEVVDCINRGEDCQ
jgi:cytochrome c